MSIDDLKAATARVIHQMMTGANNETIAIGRVLSVPFAVVGWAALPYLVAKHVVTSGADAGAYLAAHATSIALLIRGTSGTEPPPAG